MHCLLLWRSNPKVLACTFWIPLCEFSLREISSLTLQLSDSLNLLAIIIIIYFFWWAFIRYLGGNMGTCSTRSIWRCSWTEALCQLHCCSLNPLNIAHWHHFVFILHAFNETRGVILPVGFQVQALTFVGCYSQVICSLKPKSTFFRERETWCLGWNCNQRLPSSCSLRAWPLTPPASKQICRWWWKLWESLLHPCSSSCLKPSHWSVCVFVFVFLYVV